MAFDDGQKTTLRLKQQSARPSVFAMGADGRERLVNSTDLADDNIVVTGVYLRLILRDGPYVVCVFNIPLYRIDQNRDPNKPRRVSSSTSQRNAWLLLACSFGSTAVGMNPTDAGASCLKSLSAGETRPGGHPFWSGANGTFVAS